MWFTSSRCRVECEKVTSHVFINFHDASFIAASVTIVGSWENSDNLVLMTPVVPIHDQLMRSCSQFEIVSSVELLWDVHTKGIASTSWWDAPACSLVWVTPQQIAHRSFMWHLLYSVQVLDLVKRLKRWRQPSMQWEYLILNYSSQGQLIKELGEVLPHVSIAILALTLIIKAINLCDLSTLVITSQDSNPVSVSNFQCNQQCDRFDWVVSTIDVITHKQVIGIRAVATDLEQLDQIVELPMDVSTNCDWASHRLYILLTRYDFFTFLTQLLDLYLCQWFTLFELLNLFV